MRRALGLGLILTACSALPSPPPHADYRFQRPVTGVRGQRLAITDRDWDVCHAGAHPEAWTESAQRRTAWYQLIPDPLSISNYVLSTKALEQPEPPAETAYREQTYERLMRGCLVNRGYAIMVPPPPSRSFGARP